MNDSIVQFLNNMISEQNILVTTPKINTDDINKNYFLLGEWCKNLEDDLQPKKNLTVMRHHWTSSEKLFYSISEVAKRYDVNVSLIRFWEKEFDILKPKKNKKGNRLFRKQDIDNLDIIFHLVKERGFTLAGAKKKLKENKKDTVDHLAIVKKLKEIKSFLVNLREDL